MARGYLVSNRNADNPRRVPVDVPIILGRTKDCAVVVEDAAASRHHMEIIPRSDSFYWRDLNSTNGVIINDQSMTEGELRHGDRIRIGSTVFYFEVSDDAEPELTTAPPPAPVLEDEPDTTLFRETIMDAEGRPVSIKDRSELHEMLEGLHLCMQEIATNYDPCGLVDKVLEATMKAVHGQRGAIFFARTGSAELLPCMVCGNVHSIKDGAVSHSATSEIKVSQTVARRVLRHGESVLIQDTQLPGGGSSTESIISLKLRSILCVPIRGKYGVFGILYIDTDRPEHQYNRNHMLLSTAVGGSAGLALENARLHQEILDKLRTDQEIEYAGNIQSGFLVREWPPDDNRFVVYGDMRPAKIVGGDFYDYVRRGPDEVGILIGDVSGKGVPAALAMAQILADFRVRAMQTEEPSEVISALNRNFVKQSQRGMFCTLFYLTVNLTNGKLKCSNAGHHPAMVIRVPGIDEIGAASDPPIGIMEGIDYEQQESELYPGDTVLLYTDGITEARAQMTTHGGVSDDSDFEMYGSEKLEKLLAPRRKYTPSEMAAKIFDDVWAHCDPNSPHDDCTLIALRYNG